MKSVKYACALVVLGVASQAQATQYAWCTAYGPEINQKHQKYRSGIIEVAEGFDALHLLKEGPFGRGFYDYVQATTGRALDLTCNGARSLRDARSGWEDEISANRDRIDYHETGWLGGRPAAVGRNEKRSPYETDGLILTLPGQKVDIPKVPNSDPAKQQWEIDYEYKMAKYQEELARQQQAVAEYERAKAETEARRAELAERARKARADHEREVARCQAEGRCAVTKQ